MLRNKLIIKHVLKRVLLSFEHTSELNSEIQRIGIEYVKLTQREITQEKEYKETNGYMVRGRKPQTSQ